MDEREAAENPPVTVSAARVLTRQHESHRAEADRPDQRGLQAGAKHEKVQHEDENGRAGGVERHVTELIQIGLTRV